MTETSKLAKKLTPEECVPFNTSSVISTALVGAAIGALACGKTGLPGALVCGAGGFVGGAHTAWLKQYEVSISEACHVEAPLAPIAPKTFSNQPER